MREVADGLRAWRADGRRFALVTVLSTWASAPRPVGTRMAVAEDGEVLGNITGGCVEAAVHEVALAVLASGRPERHRYGVASDDLVDVGLMCGGEIEVYVEPIEPGAAADLDEVLEALAAGRPATLVTGPHDEPCLEHSFEAVPRMILFGAIDLADAVACAGRFLGYRVTVCDARPVFATAERFPNADEVVVDWPHRYLSRQQVDRSTVLCVMTHDAKFDLPLIEAALATDAGYIGVMGSRQTQSERGTTLIERGVPREALARLHGPIGLDLGARTPAETAVSVAAEIVAWRHGRSGRPLREVTEPIHDEPQAALVCRS
ncbi:MAG TPA: XdhC family protein [Marmoricola sp.]|jgi:xanthine dehydrogenase accessory factor|nr:XdhC family protein [Marmoricola sp.]